MVCATGPFHWARGFPEKRVKCFWRIVGPARRLTLPLQKGDWTRWVSLPAEPTFLEFLNGNGCKSSTEEKEG